MVSVNLTFTPVYSLKFSPIPFLAEYLPRREAISGGGYALEPVDFSRRLATAIQCETTVPNQQVWEKANTSRQNPLGVNL